MKSILSAEVKDFKVNSGSSVYIRWGRRKCPDNDTDTVYTGIMGGGRYDESGSITNYLCLPMEPLWDSNGVHSPHVGYVYGTEYETFEASYLSELQNQEAPCVVCKVRGRHVMMVPARNQCFHGWRLEYSGHLMAEHHTHKGNKEAICVDGAPEITDKSIGADQNGALLYFVQAKCGSLKCPPYEEDKALSCAICSI